MAHRNRPQGVVLPQHEVAYPCARYGDALPAQSVVLGTALSVSAVVHAAHIRQVWLAVVCWVYCHLRPVRPVERAPHKAHLRQAAPLQRSVSCTHHASAGRLRQRQEFSVFARRQPLCTGGVQRCHTGTHGSLGVARRITLGCLGSLCAGICGRSLPARCYSRRTAGSRRRVAHRQTVQQQVQTLSVTLPVPIYN